MAKTAWQAYIEGDDGLPVASPTIEVRIESSGALATIYSNAAGSAQANPFTGGTDGLARFYASAGVYKITATSGAFTSSFRYVPIGEAAGYDIGASTGKVMTYDQAIDTCGKYFTANQTITVGTGGDFSLLSDALKYCSKFTPVSGAMPSTPGLFISLLTGFELNEQILVAGVDLSHVRITSVDPVVTIKRSALTTTYGTSGTYAAFFFNYCVAPTIYCSFNLDSSGTSTNRAVLEYVAADGLLGETGIAITGGVLANVMALGGSRVFMDNVDVSGASATYGIYCGASHVYAKSVDASSSGTYGFKVAEGGIIVATSSTGTTSETINTVTANGIIFK